MKTLLRSVFSLLAKLASGLGYIVGRAYTIAWPKLGIYYFEHKYDFLIGPAWNSWAERGAFGMRVIPEKGKVLDICCGDGFFDNFYYSNRASTVDAFDRDSSAIQAALKSKPPNISFFVQDALAFQVSANTYDAIFLFAAIEHFTPEDGHKLLDSIRSWLKPGGTFLGSTPIFENLGGHNDEHQNEFLNEESLRIFIAPHFPNLTFYLSKWPNGRQECYFQATKESV